MKGGDPVVSAAGYRSGYPESFYRRLGAFDVGVPGQRVLDIGTGAGALARALAKRGCRVTAIDTSAEQIGTARRLCRKENVAVDLQVAPAEQTGLPEAAFDVVCASRCWSEVRRDRGVPEVCRLLAPGGVFVTAHLRWLPRRDVIACTSEEVVLKHVPGWSGADYGGAVEPMPDWAADRFELAGLMVYDVRMPFTRGSWRDHVRACIGLSGLLAPEPLAAFDEEHARILEVSTPESDFTVLHRIDAHIFRPIDNTES